MIVEFSNDMMGLIRGEVHYCELLFGCGHKVCYRFHCLVILILHMLKERQDNIRASLTLSKSQPVLKCIEFYALIS